MVSSAAVVNCSAYRHGKKHQEMSIEDISEALLEPETFVWVGLVEPGPTLLQKMQEEFGLHELAIEDAQHAHQRPKFEEYGETLFMVLHSAEMKTGQISFGETHVFLGPRFILTVRHGQSTGYAGVRARCESMPERLAKGPGYVLYLLLDYVVDQYQPCIDHFQAQLREFEHDLFTRSIPNKNLKNFYDLKNKLLTLQDAAFPLVDICTNLLRFHSEIIPKDSRIYYRDILDHVARINQSSSRMQEMINAAMQVALAQITIRQNEVVKRLAGWGAIFAVPTMVFSLYGMNFKLMPELAWEWGYPAVLVVIGLGCGVLYRRLRKVGWL